MRWFYNLKIGTKLLSSFILLALVAGVIGGIGISSIRKGNDNDTKLYEQGAIPVSQLGRISSDFQRVRVNLAKVILVRDNAEKQKYVDTIKEISANITKVRGRSAVA